MSSPAPAPRVDLPALLRRTHLANSSPIHAHDLRFELRNSEAIHFEVLESSRLEHVRIRENALRVFELYQLREQQKRDRFTADLEEKRIRLHEEAALDELKRRDLEERARNIPAGPAPAKTPSPSPPPPPPPPGAATPPPLARERPTPPAQVAPPAQTSLPPPAQAAPSTRNTTLEESSVQTTTAATGSAFIQAPTANPAPVRLAPAPTPLPKPTASTQPLAFTPPAPRLTESTPVAQAAHPVSTASPEVSTLPHFQRYKTIHGELKSLRKNMEIEKSRSSVINSKMGDLRRAIKKSIGQLTHSGEKGVNKKPMNTIIEVLHEALQIESPQIDPGVYMVTTPPPSTRNVANNGATLPALFLYLLNMFAKAICSQWVDEAGASPEAANPTGVIAVTVFARDEFLWRGETLIDILIAKIQKIAPVLFGARGNEATNKGKESLGWQRAESGGPFVNAQRHYDRMKGMGAGYASICLRNFSKSRYTNPWPAHHYWETLAVILSTPSGQVSSTQYTILRALININEKTFIDFYGSNAVALLRVALVDFPQRAPANNAAAANLKVLADKLNKDYGLQL